jgi:hypothetical protein
MTQTPPDLGQPYDSDRDRIADRDNLIYYWFALEPLVRLAEEPESQWPEPAMGLIEQFSTGSRIDDSAARLRRWASLYEDEINLIRDTRNRVVHGEIVTDPELLGATWLAQQILATLAGIDPARVDRAWARSVAGRAS